MKTALYGLVRSRKFWLAVLALVQTVLFQLVPSFPKEVWQAMDGLICVVIAAIAVEDAAFKYGMARSTENDD